MSWNVIGWRVRAFDDRDKLGTVVDRDDDSGITVKWDSGEIVLYPRGNNDIMIIPPDDIANELQESLNRLKALGEKIDKTFEELKETLTAPLN